MINIKLNVTEITTSFAAKANNPGAF